MDPTELILRYTKSSFNAEDPSIINERNRPPYYSLENDRLDIVSVLRSLSPQIQTYSLKDYYSANTDLLLKNYADINAGERFINIVNKRTNRNINNEGEYYDGINSEILNSRSALKLANVDAVYGILEHMSGLMTTRIGGIIYYVSIGHGTGTFLEYIQYRRSDAIGLGMTLRSLDKPLDKNIIDTSRFYPITGKDGTGNIIKNYQNLIDNALDMSNDGMEYVFANSGMGGDENKVDHELLVSRLLLTEIFVALRTLRVKSALGKGGIFVCRVFDTVTPLSLDILWLLSICFESVSIIKPVTSRRSESEKYVVAYNLREHGIVNPVSELISKILDKYGELKEGETIVRILADGTIPGQFKEWLTDINEYMYDLHDKVEGSAPLLNLQNALYVWNLAGYK
ncbi:FtsJ-like methyltransferase [Orpheovirus IHUMI-LCC2]|uniref:FtsJ-like methyltransferase n=1 Tax=Orpheovirus IHUMI-LCC2 TaxID=2023057 RepID=A0A2I2L5Z2_9VIRU|nr:FtsJ-like methyltransferase [Orpheovirus IHUMI-LCC2]SNW62954.1 FtsJ-like methyltransferase [Orpheovirus IHUMI-LCC2]